MAIFLFFFAHIRQFSANSGNVLLFVLIVAAAGLSGCAGPSQVAGPRTAPIGIDAAHRTDVVMAAMSMLGAQYKYGGSSPDQGFDCSGLVAYAVDIATQVKLPRSTAQIASVSQPVSRRSLSAGDLVFFNTLRRPNSHVGIYLGDGQFINAPSSGGRVRIDSMSNPYFAKRFDGARTLFQE